MLGDVARSWARSSFEAYHPDFSAASLPPCMQFLPPRPASYREAEKLATQVARMMASLRQDPESAMELPEVRDKPRYVPKDQHFFDGVAQAMIQQPHGLDASASASAEHAASSAEERFEDFFSPLPELA